MGVISTLLKQTLKKTSPKVAVKKAPLELPKEPIAKEVDLPVVKKSEAPVSEVADVPRETFPAAKELFPTEKGLSQVKEDIAPVLDGEALDIAGKPSVIQTPEDVVVELKHTLSDGLEQFDEADTHIPNFDTFETTDDVKAVIGGMADRNRSQIEAARGPIQTDEQVLGLAKDLGESGNVVTAALQRQMGETFDGAQVVALRQFIQASAGRLKELGTKIASGDATQKEEVMFARQHMLHGEVMSSFMGSRAEAGRRLRAHGIKISSDDFEMDRMSEITQMMGGRNLKKVAQMYKEMDSTAKINKVNKVTTMGKARAVLEEVFINSILSGVKTLVVNTTGNAIFPMKGWVDTAVAARMGKFMSGEEHVMVGEAQAEIFGYFSAIGDGFRMAAKAFKNAAPSDGFSKIEVNYPKAISSENLELGGSLMRAADFFNLTTPKWMPRLVDDATDVTGAVIRFPTERVMTPTDEFFKTLARRGHVARAAFREANGMPPTATPEEIAEKLRTFIENPPESVMKEADDFALYQTFQDPLGESGKKVQSFANNVPGIKFIIPFVKTPTNIFKRAMIDSSPLGLFSSRIRSEIAGGGAKRDLALARISVGTGLAGITAMNVASGMITGGGPSDFKALSVLRATGWQPYSIRVRNPFTGQVAYHSYLRLEPMAFVIGAVADTVEMLQWHDSELGENTPDEEIHKHAQDFAMATIAGIVENSMNKTFMSGAASFVEATSDPDRYMMSYLQRMAGAMIPYSALRRDLTKIQDPYIREAWTGIDKLKKAGGLAGWSDDMPIKRDVYGDAIYHPSGDLLGVLSPFPESKLKFHPVKTEVSRVMMETRRVPLTKPSKRINGVKLDVHQYDRLIMLSRQDLTIGGKTFMEALEAKIDSTAYERATDDSKADIINDITRSFDRAAKGTLRIEDDTLEAAIMQRMQFDAGKKVGEDVAEKLFERNK